MDTILTIKGHHKTINFEYFDDDKDVEVWIENENSSAILSVYLSANQINSIINHLAKQLEIIGEPIELLTK